MKKYESLAADLEALIASGTIQPGERLPSVRQTIAARHLSPSTVFEAYYLLEARGLVEARQRSGYFVKGRPTLHNEPQAADPAPVSREVFVNDLVLDVLGAGHGHSTQFRTPRSGAARASAQDTRKTGARFGKVNARTFAKLMNVKLNLLWCDTQSSLSCSDLWVLH
jgi:DNA-binding transcriptional MocR family regulator